MTIYYHAADRKALVKAISEITEVKPKYLGMPSAAYEIDYFTVDREGNLSFDDMADSEEIENLIERLDEMGFIAEEQQAETNEQENITEASNLTVSLPADKVNEENLKALLNAKGELIKKALGVEGLAYELDGDKIEFPWFNETHQEAAATYTKFISALCEMSIKQKRITAKPKENENEKYAFRCFLLRLGFIGDEFKADRKILLKNLSGSSAFKSVKEVA